MRGERHGIHRQNIRIGNAAQREACIWFSENRRMRSLEHEAFYRSAVPYHEQYNAHRSCIHQLVGFVSDGSR